MAIPAGGEIGAEIHDENDQFFRFEAGMLLAKKRRRMKKILTVRPLSNVYDTICTLCQRKQRMRIACW